MNAKIVWWSVEIKAASKRKKAAWKEVLGARREDTKERFIEAYKERKRKVKMCIYQSKREDNEQFEIRLIQM